MLRSKLSFLLSIALPLAVVAGPALAPATALADAAQGPAGTPVAAPLPRTTVKASFLRYVLAPHGRPIGLLLSDGSFVHTPGHSIHRDAPQLVGGDAIEIEAVAVKTPAGTTMFRQAIVRRADGTVIADATKAHGRHAHRGEGGQGGEHKKWEGHAHKALSPVAVSGKIGAIVTGPKGHVLALVLADGTTAVGHHLGELGLKVGDQVALAGQGGTYALGKSLRVEKITLPNGQVRDLPARTPRAPDPSQTPA
jgi:hypothetical protein